MEGPRIYNLFPRLVGTISKWEEYLPKVANMGFNWVFLNPFHYPGFSGSLYAVKDYYRLNPEFIDPGDQDPFQTLRHFVSRAGELGLKVMMDLVINHTAKDSVLVEECPEWFNKNPDGSIKSPSAIDPADSRKVTVWGDLAEIDHLSCPDRHEQWEYWRRISDFYAEIGVEGFRCDAAYKIPSELWSYIIGHTKDNYSGVVFFGETLGCRLDEIKKLASAGFDYFFNSSKWWDFQADWCLEQYESNRHIAPSISFPETHDTDRLAAEVNGNIDVIKRSYAFAAAFSAGIMMPIGYEYGFRKRLNVVRTNPSDWENPGFDISEFVKAVNNMKAHCPILNEECPIRRIPENADSVAVLLKYSEKDSGKVCIVLNRDVEQARPINLPLLFDSVDAATDQIEDISPERRLNPVGRTEYVLGPAEVKVFHVLPRC